MKHAFKLSAALTCVALVVGVSASQAASVDAGKNGFATHCASCHSVAEGRNWSNTRNAISQNKGGMGYLSSLSSADLLNITTYLANPNTTDSDRLFNWAENVYPNLLSPRANSQSMAGYYLRYYSQSNIYVATQNGQLYFYDANNPAGGVAPLGTLNDWLNQAGL